jgi:hypothetical protein
MRTRNGIYYDLSKSVYKCRINDTHTVFIFSSDLHLVKFEEQIQKNRDEFNIKMKARYGIECNMKALPDILLYKKLETRGFLVLTEGGQALCLENLTLNGEKVTHKS